MLEKKITIQERLKIRRYISNHTTEETARKFNVSVSSVYKIVNNGMPRRPETIAPDPRMPKEPEVCKRFGCGKRLSAAEKLYGNYCQAHSKILII